MYIAISTIIFLIIIISAILFYVSIKSFYKKNPNNIPAEYLQSMNYLLSEQHDKAIDTFMSMVSVNKDTAETHIILGNLFRNRGEVDRAIRIHQNLIARPELKPEIRQQCSIELARDYLKSGFLDRAEQIFKKLSFEIDNPVVVCLHLKEIYEQEKEWKKAIDISERIQSISNEDLSDTISHYYCELAENEIILSAEENLNEAKKYINKALNYNKKSVRALILLGDVSFQNKNFNEALKRYIGIFDAYPDFSHLVLEKLKITYEKLGTNENFFTFIKSLSSIRNPMELYSNLSDYIPKNMSDEDISELYNTEFVDWECPDGSEPPSWDEVETEIKREVEIYNYYLYERQREKLYPDWKTQMDMLYHDIKNKNLENGSWIQSIDNIKSTYPKPE